MLHTLSDIECVLILHVLTESIVCFLAGLLQSNHKKLLGLSEHKTLNPFFHNVGTWNKIYRVKKYISPHKLLV